MKVEEKNLSEIRNLKLISSYFVPRSMSAADDAGVEQRLFVHVEGMSSPTDPELEAAGTLAGFSQLAHPKVPPRPNQYPITTLTAHQNYDGPPARPLIAPNALFHQPSAPIVPAPREYLSLIHI